MALRAPLLSEEILFTEGIGRYVSEDVIAVRDQPAAALSAMDGYAIRFDDLPGPWSIIGEIPAGAAPSQAVGRGEAIRIFTGAMVPNGADSVIVQEDVCSAGRTLTLLRDGPAVRGQHIRGHASDFAAGAHLLHVGARLTPGAIAAAIMGGAARLTVGKRPRVAILTTGDELIAPGLPLGAGQIPNSNGAMLAAMLASEPADISALLHVRDDRLALSNTIKDLARRHDVIVTIGGASVGDHDHVRGALLDAGGRIDFWKIAMRPGKPLMAGTIGDSVLIGLPGNPASTFVTAALFLLPLVRHLAGARDPLPPVCRAPLAAPLGPGGRRCDYLRARLEKGVLTVFDTQDSGQTLPLALANALVIRPIDAPERAADTLADYVDIA